MEDGLCPDCRENHKETESEIKMEVTAE
jgi:hypothetical protein